MNFDKLREIVKGDLYTDEIKRIELSTDASIFMVKPLAVLYPKDCYDVAKAVKFAVENKISVHPRGAGSGLCGSAVGRGLVIDFTKYMNRLLSLDLNGNHFTCEPGYRHGELEISLNNTGMFFPAAPSSGEYATFGGMYATNAGGEYSVKYGNTSDYIMDAEIVLSDGSIHRFSDVAEMNIDDLPKILKKVYKSISKNTELIDKSYPPIKCNVSGYELRDAVKDEHLFLHKLVGGAEGTFGIVTQLKFSILKKKPFSSLLVGYFNDKESSAEASQVALEFDPAAIEIMDKTLLTLASTYRPELKDKIPSDIDNLLLIEFDGDTDKEVVEKAKKSMQLIKAKKLSKNINFAVDKEEIAQLSAVRKSAVPILYQLKGDKKILALVEDAAVPTKTLTAYFKGIAEIFAKYNVDYVSYGHIAKGLLHTRPLLNLKDGADVSLLKPLADEVYELVSRLNGTISGEHGDGRLRSCYIPRQYKAIYNIFLKVKENFDPSKTFNPDIKTNDDVSLMAKDLRYGAEYKAEESSVYELIWNDNTFIEEAELCHGCSKCTTITNATRMCPVYKSTKDENATPKAKANILRAYLSGRLDPSMAMFDEPFMNVINHCVNCGSCSIECPSKVNIPKLALEVKARYFREHGASLTSHLVTKFELMGKLFHRFGSLITKMTNPLIVRKLMERFIGLAHERKMVLFSKKTIKNYIQYNKDMYSGKTVIYFAGCYASYIKPEITESTINVLKKLGYTVIVPKQTCCGIPHISKGMVDQTRGKINKNLELWGEYIDQADYIVTSCSSCALSLYKEWSYCIDSEEINKVKSKIIYITDLIKGDLDNLHRVDKRDDIGLVYHMSCHMKLLPNPTSTIDVLNKLDGVDSTDLNSSCCGMAGSWGLYKENYTQSLDIASSMINKMNKASVSYAATDCPTCAMQMTHLGNKEVIHPIQVIEKCLK